MKQIFNEMIPVRDLECESGKTTPEDVIKSGVEVKVHTWLLICLQH